MADGPDYWFPAKRYGWGWGLPATWQGWLVLAAYIVVMALDVIKFPPGRDLAPFAAVALLASLSFVGICWWKGEPPRWRWGED